MKTIMVTGGAGFFGGIVKRHILDQGYRCVSVDLMPDEDVHPNLVSHQLDICEAGKLRDVFAAQPLDGVVHCAAILAHGSTDEKFLWNSNVEGTRNVMDAMRRYGVSHMVFTSSNCLWGEG